MSFSELIYPSCPLCRHLRLAMGVGLLIVIVTYMVQLLNMDKEAKRNGMVS